MIVDHDWVHQHLDLLLVLNVVVIELRNRATHLTRVTRRLCFLDCHGRDWCMLVLVRLQMARWACPVGLGPGRLL